MLPLHAVRFLFTTLLQCFSVAILSAAISSITLHTCLSRRYVSGQHSARISCRLSQPLHHDAATRRQRFSRPCNQRLQISRCLSARRVE